MGNESTSTNVPVLSEHNYPTWKIRIRGKLQREKVWGTISGDDPDLSTLPASAPSAAATTTSISTMPTSTTAPLSSLSDTWKIRNDKALGIIIEYISNEKLDLIADETSAKSAWEKLEKVHQGTNPGLNAFFTLKNMMQRKYADASSMEEHIATFAADNRKLTAMGKAIGDEMQAFLVLTSLPSTSIWDTFTTSLLQSLPANSTLTFETVSTRLLSQSLLVKGSSTPSEPPSALVADTRTGPSGNRDQGQYCDYHESHGHATKDCRDLKDVKKERKKRKRKPREREKSGKAKANKAETDSDMDSDSDESDTSTIETKTRSEKAQHARTKHRRNERVYITKTLMKRAQLYVLAASVNSTRRSKDILIDSGCSRHMTPHRSWFIESTYRKLRKPILIHLGDDSTIKAVGVGSMQCMQHLQGERRHLTINDVLYAPNLAVTLLSVR